MWHWEFNDSANGWLGSMPGHAGCCGYATARSAVNAFYEAHHRRYLGTHYRLLRDGSVVCDLTADFRDPGVWKIVFTNGSRLKVDFGW